MIHLVGSNFCSRIVDYTSLLPGGKQFGRYNEKLKSGWLARPKNVAQPHEKARYPSGVQPLVEWYRRAFRRTQLWYAG